MRTDEIWLLILGSQASSIAVAEGHLYKCRAAGRTDVEAEETLRQMRKAHRGSMGRAPLHVLQQFASTYGEPRQT